MKLFNREDINEYSLKKYVDKNRIIIYSVLLIVVSLITVLSLFYLIDTKVQIKRSNKYMAEQINKYNEEQERLKEIEIQKEKERQARKPQLTDVGKENMRTIYDGKIRKAFLTFDDGPSNNTRDILDILKERKIKATFFVLGSQVPAFPETMNRMYNEGHFIANHGYTHRYSEIYKSPETVLNEFNMCNQAVADTIGVPDYNSHLFRFPGGVVGGRYADIKNAAISLLDQNSITYIDWNSLTGDAETATPTEEYLMDNLQRTTNEKQVVVLLMHDSEAKRITVDVLPKVIDYLSSQGYEFDNFYSIIK